MSAITTTEEHILAFAKYARNSDDETILQASDNLLLLFEANKNKKDLNSSNFLRSYIFKRLSEAEMKMTPFLSLITIKSSQNSQNAMIS